MTCLNRFRYTVSLTIVFIVNYIVYILVKNGSQPHRNRLVIRGNMQSDICRPLCVSIDCILTANNIVEYADFNVDPCDDFYKHSCGNYLKTRYPVDGMYMGLQSVADDSMQVVIRKMVEGEGKTAIVRAMRTVFHHCLDHDAKYRRTLNEFREILSQLGMKDWPRLKHNFAFPDGLDNAISTFKFLSKNTYSLVDIQLRKETHCGLHLDKEIKYCVTMYPSIPINYQGVSNTDNINQQRADDFRDAVWRILTFFDNVSRADAIKYADEILELEFQMYNLLKEEIMNYSATNSTTENIRMNLVSESNWAKVIRFYLEVNGVDLDIYNLPLIIYGRNFLEKLKILFDSTHHRIFANYMTIILIFDSLNYFGLSLISHIEDNNVMKPFLHRSEEDDDIQTFCLNTLQHELELQLSLALIDVYFDDATIDFITSMQYSLMNITYDVIDEMTYLDNNTNKVLKKVIKSIPLIIEKVEYYAEVYKQFSLKGKTFFYNMIEWNIYSRKLGILQLLNEVEQPRVAAPDASAYSVEDFITIGLALMRFPAFSTGRPQALNVANVGTIISHEIVHLLDRAITSSDNASDTRSKSSGLGGLRYRFEQSNTAAQCLIEKYSSFIVSNSNETLDGELTFNENFADILGVQIGFRAYRELVKKHGTIRLPGIAVTSNQLYFLSFAENFCKVSSDTFKSLRQNRTDVHSEISYRVIGPLSELSVFSTTYSCPASSPMNDSKKCVFNTWDYTEHRHKFLDRAT